MRTTENHHDAEHHLDAAGKAIYRAAAQAGVLALALDRLGDAIGDALGQDSPEWVAAEMAREAASALEDSLTSLDAIDFAQIALNAERRAARALPRAMTGTAAAAAS